MKININKDGNILSAGSGNNFTGVEYNNQLPADFMNTFSLGKYTGKLIGGNLTIVEDPDFVMPEPVDPFPQEL